MLAVEPGLTVAGANGFWREVQEPNARSINPPDRAFPQEIKFPAICGAWFVGRT